MSEYKFDWSGFTAEDFTDYCAKMENSMIPADEYVGCCRVGELCFDLVTRDLGGDELALTYDLYVGGIDTGYGYSRVEEGYPYTEADGDFLIDACISYAYEDFKSFSERVFTQYIEHSGYTESMGLIAKAKAPLHNW